MRYHGAERIVEVVKGYGNSGWWVSYRYPGVARRLDLSLNLSKAEALKHAMTRHKLTGYPIFVGD